MATEPGITEARDALRVWLRECAFTLAEVAGWLDVSQPTVSRWLSGANRPDEPQRSALEDLTDGRVPARWWLYLNERELLDRARALRTGTEG